MSEQPPTFLYSLDYIILFDIKQETKMKRQKTNPAKKPEIALLRGSFGADNRIWTDDLFLTMEALYLLSYTSIFIYEK